MFRLQDEKVKRDVFESPHETPENCKTDVLQNKTDSITLEQQEKQNSDSNCEDVGKFSKKDAGESDTSLNESNSNASSNSSASSDIISGTPQPVSRRQSFITLEKFNSSENRPFSSSTFSNTSGASESIPLLTKPGSAIPPDVSSTGKPNGESKSSLKLKTEETHTRTKRSCLEIIDALETYVKFKKAKEGSKAHSKSLSESTLGIKRSSLRQNNTDISEDKPSKIMYQEQEKNTEVAPGNHGEDKHDIPNKTQEAERLLDIQSQTSALNAMESTMVENKQTLDSASEMKVVPNFDSKENTPPEVEMSGEVIPNVSQTSQMPNNQKTLRRSLRRRSEASEGGVDSQDKENNQQKKDGCREDDKILAKKTAQNKETGAHKQKSLPEKVVDTQSVQGSNAIESVECHASLNNQEETVVGSEKSEGTNTSDTDDLRDSGPHITSEKPKGLPRYHTRRCSQGLLTSIENSESDSSETREEGTMRTRSGRWKNKSNALGSQVEELEIQEFHSQMATEIQTSLGEDNCGVHSEEHMGITLASSNNKGDKEAPPTGDGKGLKQDRDALFCRDSSGTERNPAGRKATTEAPVENRQGTNILDTEFTLCSSTSSLSDVSGKDACITATVTASPSSEKSPEMSECQHKRSKRTRRSKGCDCCDEKSSPPVEKLPAALRKTCTPESKLKETRKMPSKITVALPSVSVAEELHSTKRLTQEPCATSTPLTKDLVITKDSKQGMESDGPLPRDETVKEELENPPCIGSEKDTPLEEILKHVPLDEGASEQSAPDDLSKESMAVGVDSDPAGMQVADTNQSGPSEDAEMDVNPAEDREASETVASVVQDAVEMTTVPPATVEEDPPKPEMGQEEDVESNVSDIATECQSSALPEKERNNSDSPLRSKELDGPSLAKVGESPNGMQARCIWSPSASPSTSILKRGTKRQQEEDSPSPANKVFKSGGGGASSFISPAWNT